MPAAEHVAIHASTNVDWLLDRMPVVIPVFVRRRLHCVGCPLARFETLADVSTIYGLQLDEFLSDLRQTAAATP